MIDPDLKFLRDLTRLLDMAAISFSSTDVLAKDYQLRYIELRTHLMSLRRLRISQQKNIKLENEHLLRTLDYFDQFLFSL